MLAQWSGDITSLKQWRQCKQLLDHASRLPGTGIAQNLPDGGQYCFFTIWLFLWADSAHIAYSTGLLPVHPVVLPEARQLYIGSAAVSVGLRIVLAILKFA